LHPKASLKKCLPKTINYKNLKMNNIKFNKMNTYRIIIPILVIAMVFACKPDKNAELAKKLAELTELRKQHDEIADKIKKLELETIDSSKIEKGLLVSVSEIKPTEFKHYIEVQGKLDGEDYVDVSPEAVGVVEEIYVTNGQAVKKGQPLASMNHSALRDQLKALESQYALAKETFEKQQKLWDQKIGSEIQYLQAKSGKEALESQLAATRKQIDMYIIKSPINGTVEDINIKVGQMASAANPVPPFRVINFNSIKVKAEVAEAYSQKVKTGDNVIVMFPDLNREISATISSASRYINPVNRTFNIEIRLNPDKNGFKANMVSVVKINDYKNDKAIVIPINYIQTDPDGNFVYVADKKNDKYLAKKAFIEQGQSYNGMVEISKGLAVGDKVITSGYLDLEVGETIAF
jgi:RND family efflux transporter MFP subunit